MPTPIFTIKADGVDVTHNIIGAGVSMTITDNDGLKADSLSLVIDDLDGSVIAPRTGAIINAIGGYEGWTRDFGLFSVDSVIYSGWPQQITIEGKSLPSKSLANQREPKAYPSKDYPTYGDIFQDIASKAGLTLRMSSGLASIRVDYEAQAEENAIEFLTRIGEKINASVTVKANNLVATEKGEGESVGGSVIDALAVEWGRNLLNYSVTESDKPKHKEVEATYYDRLKNTRKKVVIETGDDGPKFLMRTPYQSEEEAERAAKAHAKKLKRAEGSGTFNIDGDPYAMAGATAVVSGCRDRVDGLWYMKTVTHTFSSSGAYTTTLQCEKPSAEDGSSSSRLDKAKQTSTSRAKAQAGNRVPIPATRPSDIEAGVPSLTGDGSTNIG